MVIKIKLRRGANYSKKISCASSQYGGPQDLVENIKKAVEADGRSPAGRQQILWHVAESRTTWYSGPPFRPRRRWRGSSNTHQELGTAHAVPVFQVMPRFYFDFDDDGGTFIDKDGEEFADVDAATREAMAALGDAARDFCRSSPGGRLAISVRSEEGPIVELSATLRLNH